MPMELSDNSPRKSGEALRAVLERSMERRNELEMVPRARVTVLTWLSSLLALLSIVAPASNEVKRGGKCGRGRGEFEKNSGDGGCRRLIEGPVKVNRSWRGRRRGFLRSGGASMASLDTDWKTGGRDGGCSDIEDGLSVGEGVVLAAEVGGRGGGGGGRKWCGSG